MRPTLLLLSATLAFTALCGCKKEPAHAAAAETPKKRQFALSSLKTEKIRIDKNEWTVWIMDDDKKREEGLMFVKPSELPDGKGMLFVFDKPEKLSFWMQNTETALDIAFFGPDKKLLNVQRGLPFDETSLPSDGPASYVLEVRDGTFEKLGIKKGALLEIVK